MNSLALNNNLFFNFFLNKYFAQCLQMADKSCQLYLTLIP